MKRSYHFDCHKDRGVLLWIPANLFQDRQKLLPERGRLNNPGPVELKRLFSKKSILPRRSLALKSGSIEIMPVSSSSIEISLCETLQPMKTQPKSSVIAINKCRYNLVSIKHNSLTSDDKMLVIFLYQSTHTLFIVRFVIDRLFLYFILS